VHESDADNKIAITLTAFTFSNDVDNFFVFHYDYGRYGNVWCLQFGVFVSGLWRLLLMTTLYGTGEVIAMQIQIT
jgi:hypothetical protein